MEYIGTSSFIPCLVQTGGALFEWYILSRGKKKHSDSLYLVIQQAQICSQESQEFLVDIYGLVFWFDTVRAMHQVNQKCSLIFSTMFLYLLKDPSKDAF